MVTVHEGDPRGRHCLIIDDLVRSGGTLRQCAKALRAKGAASVSCFVAHACFPNEAAWKAFLPATEGGKGSGEEEERGDRTGEHMDKFYCTNSVPLVTTRLPQGPGSCFVVLDLMAQFVSDL